MLRTIRTQCKVNQMQLKPCIILLTIIYVDSLKQYSQFDLVMAQVSFRSLQKTTKTVFSSMTQVFSSGVCKPGNLVTCSLLRPIKMRQTQ